MKIVTLETAAQLLKAGEVVAIPTETVYGLAADARNDEGVQKIFKAKGRPADNPLIVHVGNPHQVESLTSDISEKAQMLMTHFWPGPLTLILPSAGVVSSFVTAGLDTIALRMPKHPLTLELLQTSNIPLAAPSANLSGKPSPTSVSHVKYDLKDTIAGIVDGGTCEIGLESTVIDMSTNMPTILRPGHVSQAQIEAVIGPVEVAGDDAFKPKSPGTKYAHYAPNADLYIVKGDVRFMRSLILNHKKQGLKVGVLCHSSATSRYQRANFALGIGAKGKNLYHALRSFDKAGVHIILSEVFDDEIIMNRLMKASKERILSELEN